MESLVILSQEKKSYAGLRAQIMVMCVCDKDGKRLFTNADITKLNEKSAKAGSLIFDTCLEMNGFSDEDVEELAGNLD